MDLYIRDLHSGKTEIYESGRQLFISDWNDAATNFVCFYQNEPEIRIGQWE